jgi:hypothetical protein
MTYRQFNNYCKKNKIVSIKADSQFQQSILFKNGETIIVSAGYDGEFSYQIKSFLKKIDSKMLIKDLTLLTPNYYQNYIDKYGK